MKLFRFELPMTGTFMGQIEAESLEEALDILKIEGDDFIYHTENDASDWDHVRIWDDTDEQ